MAYTFKVNELLFYRQGGSPYDVKTTYLPVAFLKYGPFKNRG